MAPFKKIRILSDDSIDTVISVAFLKAMGGDLVSHKVCRFEDVTEYFEEASDMDYASTLIIGDIINDEVESCMQNVQAASAIFTIGSRIESSGATDLTTSTSNFVSVYDAVMDNKLEGFDIAKVNRKLVKDIVEGIKKKSGKAFEQLSDIAQCMEMSDLEEWAKSRFTSNDMQLIDAKMSNTISMLNQFKQTQNQIGLLTSESVNVRLDADDKSSRLIGGTFVSLFRITHSAIKELLQQFETESVFVVYAPFECEVQVLTVFERPNAEKTRIGNLTVWSNRHRAQDLFRIVVPR